MTRKYALASSLIILTLSGCSRHNRHISTIVNGEDSPDVHTGDTVYFDVFGFAPGTKYWVVFGDLNPCDRPSYSGTPEAPPHCKIRELSGSNQFGFKLTTQDPSGPRHDIYLPCKPACNFVVGANNPPPQ